MTDAFATNTADLDLLSVRRATWGYPCSFLSLSFMTDLQHLKHESFLEAFWSYPEHLTATKIRLFF